MGRFWFVSPAQSPYLPARQPAETFLWKHRPAGGSTNIAIRTANRTTTTATSKPSRWGVRSVVRVPGSVNPDKQTATENTYTLLTLHAACCPKGPCSVGACRTAGAHGVAARMSKVRLLHGRPQHSLVCCPPGCTQRAGFGAPPRAVRGPPSCPPKFRAVHRDAALTHPRGGSDGPAAANFQGGAWCERVQKSLSDPKGLEESRVRLARWRPALREIDEVPSRSVLPLAVRPRKAARSSPQKGGWWPLRAPDRGCTTALAGQLTVSGRSVLIPGGALSTLQIPIRSRALLPSRRNTTCVL